MNDEELDGALEAAEQQPEISGATPGDGDPRVDYYQGADGDWYWRRWRSSDEVADGAEGYSSENAVIEAARRENPGLPLRKVEA